MHQHVTGQEGAVDLVFAAAAHLDHLLGGDENLIEQMGEAALVGLLLDRVAHLLLEVGEGMNNIPALGHGSGAPRRKSVEEETEAELDDLIDDQEKIEATITITNTMAVVISVSRRVGHVTLEASLRTS